MPSTPFLSVAELHSPKTNSAVGPPEVPAVREQQPPAETEAPEPISSTPWAGEEATAERAASGSARRAREDRAAPSRFAHSTPSLPNSCPEPVSAPAAPEVEVARPAAALVRATLAGPVAAEEEPEASC